MKCFSAAFLFMCGLYDENTLDIWENIRNCVIDPIVD